MHPDPTLQALQEEAETPVAHMHRGTPAGRDKRTAVYKLRREASEETNPAAPRAARKPFLLLKPPVLWYFITVALTH